MSAIINYFGKAYQSLPELQQTKEYQALNATVHTIVGYTLILTVLLELWSLPTVRLLFEKQPNGRELYAKAWFWNIFNQYFLAIPLYSTVGTLLTRSGDHCDDGDENYDRWNVGNIASNLSEIVWVWGIHAIGYYYVHKAFHLSPKWYKYHKFHHRFNTHVPPSSANAVEAVEYVLAYLLPFVLALAIWSFSTTTKIHAHNLSIAASVIAVLNLLVHTPKLEDRYMFSPTTTKSSSWTRWFVSTEDHLNHHRKLKCHYASPTLNVDNIVEAVNDSLSSGASK